MINLPELCSVRVVKRGESAPSRVRFELEQKGSKLTRADAWDRASGVFRYSLGARAELSPTKALEEGEVARLEWARLGVNAPKLEVELSDALTVPAQKALLRGLLLGGLDYTQYKSKKPEARAVSEVLLSGKWSLKPSELNEVLTLTRGVMLARSLSEAPSNFATPSSVVETVKRALAQATKNRAKGVSSKVTVWGRAEIKKNGMGLLTAVSQGSVEEPRFICIELSPGKAKSKNTLALVGKGVTFDTGGVNLKVVPWRDLISMKGDMSGASAVLSAAVICTELGVTQRTLFIAPLTYNSLDGNSIHPGDVVVAKDGTTVEIQNTDAEGRLILADALAYAVEQGATQIVDVATLTGACAIALGGYFTGLFSTQDKFAAQVSRVATETGEPVWRMPLTQSHMDEVKGVLSDLKNMGKSRDAGASIAAAFMHPFVQGRDWVHLDIAAAVEHSGKLAGMRSTAFNGRMAASLSLLASQKR